MLTLNKSFWSLDQNGLFKVSIWNDFFRSEFGRNLDMAPKIQAIDGVIAYFIQFAFISAIPKQIHKIENRKNQGEIQGFFFFGGGGVCG